MDEEPVQIEDRDGNPVKICHGSEASMDQAAKDRKLHVVQSKLPGIVDGGFQPQSKQRTVDVDRTW
jgi:hypothetical protein